MFECKRCGKCCMDVGHDFWKTQKIGDGRPCEKLVVKDSIGTCLLHGDNKPQRCKDFQHGGSKWTSRQSQ